MTLYLRARRETAKGGLLRQKERCTTKPPRKTAGFVFESRKYKRIADVSGGAFIAQQRIIATQSRVIADLRKELAKLKKLTKC